MTTHFAEGERVKALFAYAEKLYMNLSAELERALAALGSGADGLATKVSAETLRAHRKALQTILEIELQLFGDKKKSGGAHELDLEAARTEVYRRLDRLTNAT